MIFLLALLLVCPPAGNSRYPAEVALNVLKNRSVAPTRVMEVTFVQMLAAQTPYARIPRAIKLTGFVVRVSLAGPESCNCMSATERDWHVVLADHNGEADPRRWVFCEITPRMPMPVPSDLVGKRVTVQGWSFCDYQHVSAPWRGTMWEIHPITGMVVLE